MLAQILPGFRDFRTPLVTGYLWLVVLWILVGLPLPDKNQTEGVMGAINAFGSLVTPTIYLAVLSFLAYVVGMLLMVDIKPGSVVRLGWRFKLSYITRRDSETIRSHVESAFHRARVRRADGYEIEREFNLSPMVKSQQDHDILRSESGQVDQEMDRIVRDNALNQLAGAFFEDIIRSIPSLAIKLQDKNPLLYGSYDRDRSESEFRLSIAVPVTVLSIQFLFLGSGLDSLLWPWASYIGITATVALVVKGFRKRFDSVNIVVTALEIGTIESQMIARLDAIGADSVNSPPPV